MSPKIPISGMLLGRSGPAIRAAELWTPGHPRTGKVPQLLSDDERARLGEIASIERFEKGKQIYPAGSPADAVYSVIAGVIKSFSVLPDGSRHIDAFLFADDLLGLSEHGTYANSAEAITSVMAYRLPVARLRAHLQQDAGLEFHLICKLGQKLRHARRHAFLLARRDALPKLAMFLQMLEQLQAERGESTGEICLPMDRTEIGQYVGMSLPAVSRAFHKLAADGVIEVPNKRRVRIRNRAVFDALAGVPVSSADLRTAQ